jgi:hypothetical protein
VERLDLLGLITADSLRRRKDPQTSRTRKDIFTLMRREQDLEKMYEQLMHRRNELRGLSNKSKYLQNQTELSEITAALKQSTSSITANLKDHPTIVGNLNKIQKDRSSLNQLLQAASDELKEENYHYTNTPLAVPQLNEDGTEAPATAGGYTPSYSYDTLVEQVTRRSEEQRLLVETKLRQEKTSEALKKLEVELENEWMEFEKLEDAKNAQIIELTNQLKHLKKVTGLTVKYEQQTAIAQKETTDRIRANRLAELKAQVARTKADIKTDKRVNKKSLVFLAKQKDAMDALYEQWEENYAVDHGAKSREYEELTRNRTVDQLQLVSQQNRWHDDSQRKIALMKEIAVRAHEEAEYRKLMDRMYLAQCTIRFYWKVVSGLPTTAFVAPRSCVRRSGLTRSSVRFCSLPVLAHPQERAEEAQAQEAGPSPCEAQGGEESSALVHAHEGARRRRLGDRWGDVGWRPEAGEQTGEQGTERAGKREAEREVDRTHAMLNCSRGSDTKIIADFDNYFAAREHPSGQHRYQSARRAQTCNMIVIRMRLDNAYE